MNTIFVAIASYLDYEIKHTILNCIDKAKHPENLRFGVCLQYDENEGTNEHVLDFLESKLPIEVLKYHYTESQGGCWARNRAQALYKGEKYHLQVDSHTRFIQNWDEIVINDFNELKKTVDKPVLSFLPPSHYSGYDNEQHTNFKCTNTIILYGGFVFSEGQWIIDIEQDPEHYYTGEEFALSIRSYTHGYDIYTTNQIVAWHRAHPVVPKKHYNNNPEEIANAKHRHAMERLRMLIEGEDLGMYGLGDIRTIEQYGEFANIDFKNKKLINE